MYSATVQRNCVLSLYSAAAVGFRGHCKPLQSSATSSSDCRCQSHEIRITLHTHCHVFLHTHCHCITLPCRPNLQPVSAASICFRCQHMFLMPTYVLRRQRPRVSAAKASLYKAGALSVAAGLNTSLSGHRRATRCSSCTERTHASETSS